MNKMQGINNYHKVLSEQDIKNKAHRKFVGGLWEQLGTLQFEFLLAKGLRPEHKLLDIGCGSLRGGINFIKYLNPENYYGIDINESLIEAAQSEVMEARLAHKEPNLLVDDSFRFQKFGVKFDFMLSVSVFTHLPMNIIIRCLSNARQFLQSEGAYYATFFQAPHSAYITPLKQHPGGKVTFYDQDPFHYSDEEIKIMARLADLNVQTIGDWEHPRNQKMAVFSV